MAQASLNASKINAAPLPTELFGYEVIGLLGKGAGSRVYAACHPDSGQVCAVKQVACTDENGRRLIEQLENELAVGQKVNHPGLRRAVELKGHRTWLHQMDEACLVLEFFDGVTLDARPTDKLGELVACLVQTAEAVHALHALGFVHCDLQPSNVLVSGDNQVKVIDLGMACPLGTRKQRVQGSPGFMAPEQAHGQPLTAQTDVFGLGATMYWMLCRHKKPAAQAMLKREGDAARFEKEVPPPHEINDAVPRNLSNLVMECLQPSATRRPASLQELGQRLEVVQFALEHAAH